jgi:hypothetical protein
MTWKNKVAFPAIAPRRRIIATALIYGLSLTVRFTSPTGEEADSRRHGVATNDDVRAARISWPLKLAQPVALYRSLPLASKGCQAACEIPMPKMSPIASCASHP